jgi:hypothetical protein
MIIGFLLINGFADGSEELGNQNVGKSTVSDILLDPSGWRKRASQGVNIGARQYRRARKTVV